ncbi:MAG: methylmalonyl-CoA epimerase [Rhodothermales bacterium]
MPHLEHIGLAVENPKAVAQLYETLLGIRPYKQEGVEREGVKTHFLSAETAKLELLEALGPESPVARYLEKRGEGLHHLAFEVADIHAHMHCLREAGFTPLSDEPRPGADGKLIFFLHPKETHGVLVEFCQSVPTPFTPSFLPYRDGHLAVYELGNPAHPPLVVLHGAAGSIMLETEPLVRQLEPHFHLFALDFAGHGASDAFEDFPLSNDLFIDNVLALLDFFDLGTTHLFGFSLGGYVALRLAQTHPHRLNNIAVHGTNIRWNRHLVTRMAARLDADLLTARYPAIVQRLEEFHGDWRDLFERVIRFVQTLPTQDETYKALARIEHPVLVSAVDRDDLFPPGVPLALHHTLPNSSLALLPGNRHALRDLDAGLYARLLLRHFGSDE